ncbi:DNA-directed RNA polymerase subunit beta' [Candidatus Saccharibacteria bacterium]|nr:DNA-directed RNA polymerase subunit beta' [Candidatus Saccharibacteria bacterium]MCL1962863.1 DNA-directed RNA polymerase subunit beta' [Candidatus Saccharibacteria bacterium]
MAKYEDKAIADFDAVRLAVASDSDILSWSYGEVLKPETINYRTQKPERDGLFCEKIFGPIKDINPHDAKLKGVRSREAAVDKNGDLVTKSSARRERMGHIKLAAPVAHIWFMRGVPSAMSLLLNMAVKNLERIAYFQSYVILSTDNERIEQLLADNEAEFEAGRAAIRIRYNEAAGADTEGDNTVDVRALSEQMTRELEELTENYNQKKSTLESLNKGALMSENAYRNLPEEYEELVEVGMGGEALHRLLSEIDLSQLIAELSGEAESRKGQAKKKIQKRLKMLEGMQAAGVKPEAMCLTILPVIPPDLRPMVQLTGGRFATSDLNDLYRRVINRNNRLKKLAELNAPEVIARNEMRMLQEAVDALIDNSATRGTSAAQSTGNRRRLKSLSDLLKGKQGRFRQNLLGKRVDYSGRSVIVVGPELKLNECGLPKTMALELFKPFVISKLLEWEQAHNIRTASRMIEAGDAVIWDALDEVIKGKYVLLNRAPTLHRLSIQAFQPKLIEGRAIQLSPLVTTGFNADFDGDQMAVHLPLSEQAQAEARDLMSATNNLLKPADGSPILSIYQDIVLGCYYMTYNNPDTQLKKGEKPRAFADVAEANLALDAGIIKYQTPIVIKFRGKIQESTLGRVVFNELLPEDFPFINEPLTKKVINRVLARVFNNYGPDITATTADAIKDLAFEYATRSALSTGMNDYSEISNLGEILSEGDDRVAQIADEFEQGLLTEEERYNLTIKAWRNVDARVTDKVKESMVDSNSATAILTDSGARGSIDNIKQAAAMIGIQVDVSGHAIELPVRHSFKRGMTSLEAFVVTRGSRFSEVSKALKTADSGYLTRRLVDVAQDVFTVSDEDATAEDLGFTIYRRESEETMIMFSDRIAGRYAAEDVANYVKKGELINLAIADAIQNDESIESVKIMSVLSTPELNGIPQKSYGIDMATGFLVGAAEPVGVIAAQSVGEPGTQLTLDTKHQVAGGVGTSQGLARVDELLEARTPKGEALLSEIGGTVSIEEKNEKYIITVTPDKTSDDQTIPAKRYDDIPNYRHLAVENGDHINAGDRLTTGSLNLQHSMNLRGVAETERYIINEVLRIYAAQGQAISPKHLEVIVRQMFSRVQIDESGDSPFIAGDIVSKALAVHTNKQLEAEGKEPAQFTQLLLGITKTSIYSDSFLSAASFQDTTRVLISAATSGRIDRLYGLKENVIIGRKIPVGTGALSESDFVEEQYDVMDIENQIDLAE